MGPQGEEAVEATSLAARLGSAIIDIEVRRLGIDENNPQKVYSGQIYTSTILDERLLLSLLFLACHPTMCSSMSFNVDHTHNIPEIIKPRKKKETYAQSLIPTSTRLRLYLVLLATQQHAVLLAQNLVILFSQLLGSAVTDVEARRLAKSAGVCVPFNALNALGPERAFKISKISACFFLKIWKNLEDMEESVRA